VKVNTATIIATIWAGLSGFNVMAAYLLPDQLYTLILVSLGLGSVLTLAVLYFAFKVTTPRVEKPPPKVEPNTKTEEPEHISSYYDHDSGGSSSSQGVDTEINLEPPWR